MPIRTASRPSIGIAGEHELHRRPHADEPGMELEVGRAQHAHHRVAELRVLGDVDEVAGGSQLGPPGHRVAVHLRDHRLGEVPQLRPPLGDVARPRAVASRCVERATLGQARLQVVTRREAGPGAADDGDAHRRVTVGRVERRRRARSRSGVADRVALLGPVEGEAPDPGRGVVHEYERRVAGRCPRS